MHKSWSTPAVATTDALLIVTLSDLTHELYVIVHLNTFNPCPRFVILAVGSDVLNGSAEPLSCFQNPVPYVTGFAAKVIVSIHIILSAPALAF